jgi:osmotically-inducible protein OsmY
MGGPLSLNENINMKTNVDLLKDVREAIKREPILRAAAIGVIAKDGIITLTGTVDSYWKKTEAEEVAKSVAGVKAVVEKIEIGFANNSFTQDDNDVATEVVNAFKLNIEIPNDKVKVKVETGWVTLEGEVEWDFQKEAAQEAVVDLSGVAGVTNNITIKSKIEDDIEKKDIERAMELDVM